MNSKVMKVKYLLLSLMMGATALTTASAQETTAPENQLPAHKTSFESSAGHWFIELQAGVGAQFFGANSKVPFLDRVTKHLPESIIPTLSVGKWHNPYFGTRLQLMSALTPTYMEVGTGKYETLNTMAMGAHFDFMFDVANYFAPYNPKRVFHFTPFLGLGYQFKSHGLYKLEEPHRHSATINAGLQMSFRLAKRLDLVLEGQAVYSNNNFISADFLGKDAKKPYLQNKKGAYNGVLAFVTAGLRFNLGETDWNAITPMDYDMINGLNDQVNALRAENAELSKRPVSCPECPEVEAPRVEVVSVLTPRSILFGFDKSTIAPKQEYKLIEIANFVKETNTPVIVLGYSDTTGAEDYNMALSERRAKAVADALTNEYGVPTDMVTVEWHGEAELYNSKAWNRAVIVRSK